MAKPSVGDDRHVADLARLKAAAPVEIRNRLLCDQEEQDVADDKHFGWIRCYDQLLQVRGEGEFLRASRSWERRLAEAKRTGKPIPAPWVAGRVWAIGTFALYVAFTLAAMSGNVLGGILIGAVGLPVWAIIAQLPGWLNIGGSGGGSGGGNAV